MSVVAVQEYSFIGSADDAGWDLVITCGICKEIVFKRNAWGECYGTQAIEGTFEGHDHEDVTSFTLPDHGGWAESE